MAARSGAPLIVALCPDSPAARADRDRREPSRPGRRPDRRRAGRRARRLGDRPARLRALSGRRLPRPPARPARPHPLHARVLRRDGHAAGPSDPRDAGPAPQGRRPRLRQHALEGGRRRGGGRRHRDPAGLAGPPAVHGRAGGPGVPALPVQQERRGRRARGLRPPAGHDPEARAPGLLADQLAAEIGEHPLAGAGAEPRAGQLHLPGRQPGRVRRGPARPARRS